MTFLYVSTVLSWVIMFALTILVLLLYRQFGLMMMNGSRRANLQGLDLFSKAPALPLRTLDGESWLLNWEPSDTSPELGWLVMLGSANCPACHQLWHGVDTITAAWPGVQAVWIQEDWSGSSGDTPAGWLTARSEGKTAMQILDVPVTPFAYVISTGGKIVGKALVNTPTEISSLLVGGFAPEGVRWEVPRDGSVLPQSQIFELTAVSGGNHDN